MDNMGIQILLVLGLLGLSSPGCNRESKYPQRRIEPVIPTTPTWGPRTEGLQCRLRPTKRLWNPNEPILFKLDLRNEGKRVFAISAPLHPDGIGLNGRWFHQPQPGGAKAKVRPLGPGVELADLSLNLPQANLLPLGPGRHSIQVAFAFEGIDVRSGPVAIEIAAAP